ncbi:hypothetical protein GCM10028827_33830 [Mucilaginibacter myungsuensis]|uniref:Uncharacterized protein n=1 Tax=Mucilaginibacter myungsuensis TaxID=649104 RepID=A0A929PXP6_9SPHI|nr:hypothetical protein [Mucilaginibacter myungsuensis]
MEITKFCAIYDVSVDDFKKSGLNINELLAIEEDYKRHISNMDEIGSSLVRILFKFRSVHSVKYRIKDSTHVVNKIIRYKLLDEPVIVTKDNYFEKLTDLIGLRIIHLFKTESRNYKNRSKN